MMLFLQVREQVFPHNTDVRSESEEILLEAEYYMRALARSIEQGEDEEVPDENYYVDIQLEKLMVFRRLSKLCNNDLNKLKEVLGNNGYDFSPDGTSVCYLNEIYHSDYSGLTDEEDNCHGNDDHGNQPSIGQDCNQGDGDHSNGYFYIPGQFSDAEDDDSVPCLTLQYGKKTPSSTMWSYPSHTASDDVDWD